MPSSHLCDYILNNKLFQMIFFLLIRSCVTAVISAARIVLSLVLLGSSYFSSSSSCAGRYTSCTRSPFRIGAVAVALATTTNYEVNDQERYRDCDFDDNSGAQPIVVVVAAHCTV